MSKYDKVKLMSAKRRIEFLSDSSDGSVSDFSSTDSVQDCEYIPQEGFTDYTSSSEEEVSKRLCGMLPFIQMWHVTFY